MRTALPPVLLLCLLATSCAEDSGGDGFSGGPGGNTDTAVASGDGADGTDGSDGTDGADGTDGLDGTDGADGTDGSDGTDGTEPVLSDTPVPDFSLVDVNPTSPTAGQPVSPRDLLAQTSGWYFTHAT